MIKKMRWGFFAFIFVSFSFMWADYQLRLKDIAHPQNITNNSKAEASLSPTDRNLTSADLQNESSDQTPVQSSLQTSKNKKSGGGLEEVKAELENPRDLKSLAKKLNADQIEYLTQQLTSDFASMERKALSLELLSNNDSDLSQKGLRDFLDHARFKHDEASTMLKLQAQDALNNNSGIIE